MQTIQAAAGTNRASVMIGDPARAPTLADVEAIAEGRATVLLHPGARARARASEAMLDRLVADRRAIYGVTTGYGPLADRQIDPAQGNGTSAMAGIAALNGVRARRLLRASALLTVCYAEVLGGHRAAWHPLGAEARPHPGQRRASALLWALTTDSPRLHPFVATPPRIGETGADGTVLATLPQDAYSIRCAPQLLGAVDDMLLHHDAIVERELASVTDNPLVFANEEVLLHAGNFFGQHVSFASDALFNATAMLGVWAERQVARVTDPLLNRGLPPFLQGRATGLNSGFMGAQVTASALVAELRTKSAPASIQSVPTNANNQDVVTMGTIAARRAGEAVEDVARILAIATLCLAQAVELRRREDDAGFGPAAHAVLALARAHAPFVDEDRPLSNEIEAVAADLLGGGAERHAEAQGVADLMRAF